MRKIEAFGEEPTEKLLRLKLVNEPYYVDLYAVDEDGRERTCGRILEINEHGIQRSTDVNPELGFPLDAEGRVKLAGDVDDELADSLARLRSVVASKVGATGDFIIMSNGAANIYLSDIQAILDHFE